MLCASMILVQTVMKPAKQVDPKIGKRLVWKDDFAHSGPVDSKKWDFEVGKVRNGEIQFYTRARKENARRDDGHLVLEARKEPWEGSKVTSASIVSKQTWTYGYFEVRAKIPTGRGAWPAVWFLADAVRRDGPEYVSWPKCGEIDLMENVGYDPEKIHFTIHTDKSHSGGPPCHASVTVPKAWDAFHIYGLDWHPDRLDFYFDGKKVLTYNNDGQGDYSWPFHRPYYILLNLAIGGGWGGRHGVDDHIFPAQFLVDYVRVYR